MLFKLHSNSLCNNTVVVIVVAAYAVSVAVVVPKWLLFLAELRSRSFQLHFDNS